MLTVLELILSESLSPLEAMSFNFILWENKQHYINLINKFLQNRLNEKEFQKEFNQTKKNDLIKSKTYTWNEIGLRLPEDELEIGRQADFSYIINWSKANHVNLNEENLTEDIKQDLLKITDLVKNKDKQFYYTVFNPKNILLINYSFWIERQEIIRLMQEFKACKISALEFDNSFRDLVGKENVIKENEVNLKIPKDNIEIEKHANFYSNMSKLFMECEDFVPYPEVRRDDDLSEEDLRQYVKGILKQYIY